MSYPFDQDSEQQPTGYNSYSQPSQPIYSQSTSSPPPPPPPPGFQPRRYNSPGINNNNNYSLSQPQPQQPITSTGFTLQDTTAYSTPPPLPPPHSHFQENYDQPIHPTLPSQQFQQVPQQQVHYQPPNPNPNPFDQPQSHSISNLNIPGSYEPHPLHSPSGYSLQDNRDPFNNNSGGGGGGQGDADDGDDAMDLPLLTAGGGYRRRMVSGTDLGASGQQYGGIGNGSYGGNGNGNGFDSNLDFNSQQNQQFQYQHHQQQEPSEETTVRYGKIPQRQMRRYKTVKRVQLYHGNLILDCQVPPKLLERCPRKEDREFTHMRYTAATCDPSDFMEERYSLRQNLYETPRRTELFIVLTMYNEDEVLFSRTMHGVIKNIQHLCSRSRSKTWGAEGWKKVVVCIVSDGRAKVNSRTLSVLATMGVYQDGVAKNIVAGKPVTAHIYEYTVQNWLDPELKSRSSEVPVQILFCLKEKNAKKINSHRWFFSAFGPILQPNVCVLLDVGTQPGPTSIYKLWKTFDLNSNVGGACGEIVALKGKYFSNLLNPLVAAQNFEYKMSNILDKPLESVFGYITVLPGAFSAYRYIALQNDARGEGPLREYFKGETLHTDPKADLWARNAYLAEDRILCWELVSKRGSAWLLHYQRSAYAVTDVPDRAADLISQRRRWLNGSFFAGIHSSYHFGYIYRSDHTFWRKLWLHVELLYQTFNMIFAWFALGNYYITFIILTQSLADPSFGLANISVFNTVLKYYYVALLVTCFLLALGNRPAGSVVMYNLIIISFALITSYMLFAAGFITYKGIINVKNAIELDGGKFSTSDVFSNSIFRNIVLSLLSTYGLYLLGSLIFFDPAHMFTSFLQYLLIAPSYINVINVYAFCNVQDVTWGNRPEEKQSTDLGAVKATDGGNVVDVSIPTDEKDINAAYDDAVHLLGSKGAKIVENVDAETRMTDSYRAIRTNVVLAWTLSNGALVAAILSTSAGSNITTDGGSAKVNVYMTFLLFSVAGLAAFRFVGCFLYTVLWLFQN